MARGELTARDPAMQPALTLLAGTRGDDKHDPSTLSILDVVWVLYQRVLRHDPADPRSEGRDRFLVSKGHGPIALYAVLADRGFFPAEELGHFLEFAGRLGGHPDRNLVPGIEASSGSLGHGFPMAVGVALALQLRGSDRRVFVLIGDGEANEGSVWETALLAGSLHLPGLTGILIDNHTSSRPLGDVAAKFRAFGWVATTIDGRDHLAIESALRAQDPTRPSMVVAEINP